MHTDAQRLPKHHSRHGAPIEVMYAYIVKPFHDITRCYGLAITITMPREMDKALAPDLVTARLIAGQAGGIMA